MFRLPATRSEFWQNKIEANRARDARAVEALADLGWRQLIVWECALRGPARMELADVLDASGHFLEDTAQQLEITGTWSLDP